ncbi:sigma-70 family RNA polymerase sigma factor [Leptospira langatensis]|uniref:Sigma-70 family RNA polymerase sigma factor n=1 Tax=Leptospira langatensis TaxID=2484983 RepID=A0A5F1ZTU9_9LEPT|nr:sigma-70 family RNA polymerase sigma factor [Leptospira langatensis]TGK02553.1 sigma-70 family RNA polymerase sigma factor [Leptospira langatensis]TGL40246.1 sigma-70 family RNA polymerase sigma factor [Leptospira langatensis]
MQEPEHISEIYEKSKKALFVYFYSLTGEKEKAEDLIQEVFLVYTDNPSKYDPRKASFYTWGSVVGRNLYYGELRKKKRMSVQDSAEIETVASANRDPGSEIVDLWEEEHRLNSLSNCMQLLPEEDRQLVGEKFRNQATLEGIGSILGITKRSVSRRYADILKRLKRCLEGKGVRL